MLGAQSEPSAFVFLTFLLALIRSASDMGGTSKCWFTGTLTECTCSGCYGNRKYFRPGPRACCSAPQFCHYRLVRATPRIFIEHVAYTNELGMSFIKVSQKYSIRTECRSGILFPLYPIYSTYFAYANDLPPQVSGFNEILNDYESFKN